MCILCCVGTLHAIELLVCLLSIIDTNFPFLSAQILKFSETLREWVILNRFLDKVSLKNKYFVWS